MSRESSVLESKSHLVATFKLPIDVHVPQCDLKRIQIAINEAITGSSEPINIVLPGGEIVANAQFAEFAECLAKAHWAINATHQIIIDVNVYSDGSVKIAR